MKILYLDIDCLRPDHLGCFGYSRNTSPNIDRIAARGTRFSNFYCPDAPCLPSRTSLFSGRIGIHTGVINHGGEQADIRPIGRERGFNTLRGPYKSWMSALRMQGIYTATVSPFATRHSAWHFLDGFREVHDTGSNGLESAEEITPTALKWLRDNATQRENWFLHVNLWDPHTPYRAPASFGDPFEDEPAPDWMTREILDAQRASYGPHSAAELYEYEPYDTAKWPRAPAEIRDLGDFKKWIDGYDTGIRYADEHVGQILAECERLGVADDLLILVSSDHGENQGELNVYGDHQTADYCTSRIPLIVAGPGVAQGRLDEGMHYNCDLAATIAEMAGEPVPEKWDGVSFLPSLADGQDCGRPYLVVSQGAWSCQRGVRWDKWMLIRTYDPGLKDFPELMLFDIEADPHETTNLVDARPDVTAKGLALLEQWLVDMLATSDTMEDPMWQVMAEGGPLHTRGKAEMYADILRASGRSDCAERMLSRVPRRAM